MTRTAFGSLSSLRSVRLPKALNCNLKCVYHVLTQIVYNVTLDTMIAPTIYTAKKTNFTPRFFLPWKNLLCRAGRVVAPNGSRQYLSVCGRNFPMQGDVAPKAKDCSRRKLLTSCTIEGIVCSHCPRKDISILCVKSFLDS